MFFSGYTFAGGQYSLDTTPSDSGKVESFSLMNGAWDEFYVSRDITLTEIPDDWDSDTVLHAHFTYNLYIGSVGFGVDETDSLRIKRRIKNTFNWVMVFEQITETIEDFNFFCFDITPRSNTEYEYCLVPVSDGIEGVPIISEIRTDFTGIFIMEKDRFFTAQVEVDFNPQQQNRPGAVLNTINRKFPFTIHNGENNYKTGTLTAVFAEFDEKTCGWDMVNAWKYRKRLNECLYNELPKLLKYEDGRMHLIDIAADSIQESELKHELIVQTSVPWTEIGDCDDAQDLHDNGLSDYPG